MPYAIDTHCHIHLMPESERKAVFDRALAAGVQKLINVACSLEDVALCLPITDQMDNVWTSVGLHPTTLGYDLEKDLERVYEVAKDERKVVGIGEMGLDYYHNKFDRDTQIDYLVGHLNIAKQLDLPAIIHCRAGKNPGENESAFLDLIKVLKKERFSRAQIHCFSGNLREADQLLELGCYLSFTGIITYSRNEELRDIVKRTPLDRMLIETDSPYLTPDGHRGKPNEPAYVMEVAKTIATVKQLPLEHVLLQTSTNAEGFFNI
ncbi:TatD family hydrolase [Candidatus Peregrinibacteria bacterium]|nr:MAG: TatD family hydrolase [Candidatus Peregrinibacteria bacterium]